MEVRKRKKKKRGLAIYKLYVFPECFETIMGNIGNKVPAVETAKEEVRRTTGSLHGTIIYDGTAETEVDLSEM